MDCPSSESLMNTLALINTNMRLFYINLCCRNICGPTICLRAWEKRSQNLLGSHERKGSPVCSFSVCVRTRDASATQTIRKRLVYRGKG